jgi:hypothetical protein
MVSWGRSLRASRCIDRVPDGEVGPCCDKLAFGRFCCRRKLLNLRVQPMEIPIADIAHEVASVNRTTAA